MAQTQTITVGILAHVDAGKTSLTECLLHTAGATKQRGSVDKGSAVTDGLSMEKERGISIKTATVDFEWEGNNYALVDTPGHVDFSAEVDRALGVLDVVILVISAKEGVQAHTLNLWESIKERGLPVLFFMNKIDRSGVDIDAVFFALQKELNVSLMALNVPDTAIPASPVVIPLNRANEFRSTPVVEASFENLADKDEEILARYLEGEEIELDVIAETAAPYIDNQSLIPILFGSAKLDLGIDGLLQALTNRSHLSPEIRPSHAAKVFKVEYDQKFGRLAHVRNYGVALKAKDVVHSQGLEKDVKINQIFRYALGKLEQTGQLESGEIGVMTFSEMVMVGDVLGAENFDDSFQRIGQSVLSVEVQADEDKDYQKLGEALEILHVEDPQLEFKWHKDEREFHLKILGPIQTEVLKDSLHRRFNISASFKPPQVIYKETPVASAEGYVRYWMPKPCWAIMTFKIAPGELGSGVVFSSNVGVNDISSKYQNEVKRAIPWSLKQGIKGWEVTDVVITLIEGSEHNVHSTPGDFLLATPMGVLRGLENADTTLLEPMYAFEIKAHQDYLGAVSSDLNQLRAQLNAPTFDEDFFTLTGKVAVEKAMDYGIKFNASTSGKGRLKLTIDGYEPTTTTDEKIRPYRGVSPLDESQWILHMRGAFKADER